MIDFELVDIFALFYFALLWGGYSRFSEWKSNKGKCLNQVMEQYRYIWFKTLLKRDQRMVDAGIMNGLQNSTAFFTSSALFAIGGSISLLSSPERLQKVIAYIPFADSSSILMWTIKIMGLTFIFVYAFFKLAWAYRLFNYSAIMIGATPVTAERDTETAKDITDKGARLNIVAARHFNRGMRAFFFALGYLGWFIHPLVFMGTTSFVALVVYRRTFASDALAALR